MDGQNTIGADRPTKGITDRSKALEKAYERDRDERLTYSPTPSEGNDWIEKD